MGRSSNRSSSQSTQSYSGTGVGSKEVARTRGANIRNDSFYSGTGAGSIEVARPLRDPRHAGPVEVGKDIRHDLEIDVDMAVFGGEQKIRFRRLEACNSCLASGIRPGSKKQSCNACGGVICMTPAAFQDPVCASCDGTGLQKPRSCRKCKGTGVRKRRKELKVNVPQNVEDGNWIRIPGEGDAGPFGGPPGDLYVFLTVKDVPSETKRRRILNKTWRPLSRFAGRQVQRAKRINTRPISNFAGKQWQRVKQVDVRPVSRFAGKQWQRMKGVVRRIKDDDDGPSLRP
jgi:DnaJ-class molecular chaperone